MAGEEPVDQLHAGGVKRAEGHGMQRLRRDQHGQARGEESDQQPARRGEQETREQHLAQTDVAQDAGHGQEHPDLAQHRQRPQQADQRLRIAVALEIDRVEGVVRPVAHLHQETGQQEGEYLRAQDQPDERRRVLHPSAGLGFRQRQAEEPDAEHQHEQDQRHQARAARVNDRTEGEHGRDEAERAPQPHAPVGARPGAGVLHDQDLEQRQRGVPEKTEQQHHQREPPEIRAEKDAGESHGREKSGIAHDTHAILAVVREPRPDVRRDDARDHEQRHEIADVPRREADGLEIKAPVGDQRSERGEVKEIESREPPVGHKISGKFQVASFKFTATSGRLLPSQYPRALGINTCYLILATCRLNSIPESAAWRARRPRSVRAGAGRGP